MTLYEEKKIPAVISSVSLVGVRLDSFPLRFGNYFWIGDLRIVNFWAENLEMAKLQFLTDGYVTVREYATDINKWGLIADDRIPLDWYYDKFCFTGCEMPPLDIARDMYTHHGDPSNEIEQWENPESYWSKRNAQYLPNGWTIGFFK